MPLTVVGVDKSKTEAEENVGFGPDGALRGYIEKGSSFSVPLASLGKFTLGDSASTCLSCSNSACRPTRR